MNAADIRDKITEQIHKTREQIEAYREMTQPVAPDVSIGRVSRMDAINNKSVTEAALRQAEEKLRKLEYVLSKVDSPDFGVCLKCKGPIPVGRMLIRPESMHCVNCAQ
jgi:DnaK suppressor protein